MTAAEIGAALYPFRFYFIGLVGSLAAELTAALRETQNLGGICPPLYKRPFYIGARIAFAIFVAGPLPYFLDAANAVTALYMGISAPLIMDRLAKGQLASAAGTDPRQMTLPLDRKGTPNVPEKEIVR